MSIKVKVERELSDEFVGDVLVTAFDGQYGGCWYWAEPQGRFFVESEDHVWQEVHVQVNKEEPTGKDLWDKPFTANAEIVQTGIQRILDRDTDVGESVRLYVIRGVLNEDAGEIDSGAADCIIQAGWFGEIVFG